MKQFSHTYRQMESSWVRSTRQGDRLGLVLLTVASLQGREDAVEHLSHLYSYRLQYSKYTSVRTCTNGYMYEFQSSKRRFCCVQIGYFRKIVRILGFT